jgi:murein DD-endopeptidase MepM/ murein hydrolase activator NlpD
VGPHWELTRNGGATNSDFYTWGREVIAPADGEVVYARNDVPDQPRPGTVDRSIYMNMPNPGYANPGNHVLLNHGNNEYSSLGHMRYGSVRVKTGDRVKRGDVVGLAGSAGDSELPHLHYQLTDAGHHAVTSGFCDNTTPPHTSRTCPEQAGTVEGDFTTADVIGLTSQQLAAHDFAALLAAIRARQLCQPPYDGQSRRRNPRTHQVRQGIAASSKRGFDR